MKDTINELMESIEKLKGAIANNDIEEINHYANYVRIDAECLRDISKRRMELAEW